MTYIDRYYWVNKDKSDCVQMSPAEEPQSWQSNNTRPEREIADIFKHKLKGEVE